MIALVRGELLRTRTTRSFVVMVSIGIALTLLIALLGSLLEKPGPQDSGTGTGLVATASLVIFFSMILGVMIVTAEYRHGSISTSLMVEPRRLHLLAAKVIAAIIAGATIGAFTCIACLLIGELILPGRGYPIEFDSGNAIGGVVAMAVAGGLFGALGAGTGALTRNQAAAIVGLLITLLIVENLLIGLVSEKIGTYGPNGALNALVGTGSTTDFTVLTPLGGGLALLGYAALMTLLGAVAVRERDISG